MKTEDQVSHYLESVREPKQSDMRRLHSAILEMNPGCRLWFLDGKDESGKVVSNPSIGYGTLSKQYANGKTKEMFQAGISANSTGLSVYIMGIDDKKYLQEKYGDSLGKANVTGYCIKFKALKDINLGTLKKAIQDGIEQTRAQSGNRGCLAPSPHTTLHAGPHRAVHEQEAHDTFRHSRGRASTACGC